MRDIVLAIIIFGSLPVILYRPWVGIILWNWVSFMNPHKLSWGFMYGMPVAALIGGATLVGWLLVRQDKKIVWNPITGILAIFFAWTCITTVFAINFTEAQAEWTKWAKIVLMVYIAFSLIKEEKHYRYLMIVSVLSIGYFSTKGGLWMLLTGGNGLVYGPTGTFIEENNSLALATLMIIPLMVYLGKTSGKVWMRWGFYAAALLSMASVIGSYSRGGLLGMAAIALVLWWRSERKFIIGIGAACLIAVSLSFIPQAWFDRMNTIQTYEEDSSATGRLEMWGHAIRIANSRIITGGGFGVFFDNPTYDRLSPEIVTRRNVHSIYFQVLGNHGYIGLILFLMLGFAGLSMAGKIKRMTRKRPGFENDYRFGNLVQISLIAYAVSGAFLNLALFDLYYTILAMIGMHYMFLVKRLEGAAATEELPEGILRKPGLVGTFRPTTPAAAGPKRSFLRNQA